ncbi:MAG: SixA phosphatase family protein [Hyphomicrobiaceae bacterium]
MLTLSLFRHAKSAWNDKSLEDFERPLAPRGTQAAPAMASFIHEAGFKPDLVLCSAARRTRDTWALMSGTLGQPHTDYLQELYEAAPRTLLAAIRKTEADVHRLMLVGHNPGLQSLAVNLIGSGDPADIEAISAKLPTAAFVQIDLNVKTWRSVKPASGHLVRFMTPKRLP